ncbi:response regulator [Pseudomonas sp. IB20]|uniref:response regulator n=1 Tax=Pseudomonas sp. IB20 TaxID=1702250 RepID=UPI000BA107AA|nr:response regulator [Pseudomonas sp. IB20]OZO04546.1 response regulator [Pseudomonas sp. IB20]
MNSEIKILLVEDETPKITQIELLLRSLCIPMCLTYAKSVNTAMDKLDELTPDLILLDMSLPTIDVDISSGENGGRPQGFGGVEVLRYMVLSGIKCPTIVITGYEAFPREGGDLDISQLSLELKSEFPDMLKTVLHYNSTYETWKIELRAAFAEFKIESGI